MKRNQLFKFGSAAAAVVACGLLAACDNRNDTDIPEQQPEALRDAGATPMGAGDGVGAPGDTGTGATGAGTDATGDPATGTGIGTTGTGASGTGTFGTGTDSTGTTGTTAPDLDNDTTGSGPIGTSPSPAGGTDTVE